MQPYLVTGAAGFIGARFVESCNERGIPAIAVDKPAHFAARAERSSVAFGEIVDREELERWLEGRSLAAIVHLGACADTMQTNEAYLDKMNLECSRMLWRHAARRGIPLVYASSAATYGDGSQGYDDDEAKLPSLQPLNLYGWSKQNFDRWALERERAGERPPQWTGFKFFNVYGYGERHKGRMASVILHAHEQIRATGKVRLFRSHREGVADGEQKRDFIFVDDVISALHFALERPLERGIFNLGTGRARTFLDLTRAVFKAMGREERIEFVDTPIEIRDRYQYFTEARMERLRATGYAEPFTPLEEGVAQYVARLDSARG